MLVKPPLQLAKQTSCYTHGGAHVFTANCVFVRACVFQVRDTVLPTRSSTLHAPPFPTYFTEEEDLDEDLYDDNLFDHTDPSLSLT